MKPSLTQKAIARLEAENAKLRDRVRELSEKHCSEQLENAELRADNERLEALRIGQVFTVDKLKAENAELLAEKVEFIKGIVGLQVTIQTVEAENADLRAQIQRERVNYQNELVSVRAENAKLRTLADHVVTAARVHGLLSTENDAAIDALDVFLVESEKGGQQ